jgi:DNA-directed RNA polymerase subunit RPC12/RpoP
VSAVWLARRRVPWFRCADCGLNRLVLLSCKGRALCPSCGGRRMAKRAAAHLLDHIFPDVPVRRSGS